MASSVAARRLVARPVLLARLHTASRVQQTANVTGVDTYKYIPGGPILPGTVNDATTFPPPSKSHGSHHWAFERLLSAALIPLTASTFALSASPYPVLDGVLAVSLVIHSHIGFDSMLVDYVHPRKFPVIGPVAKWGLRAATLSVLVGVYQFNTTDIGLTELIMKVWHA
ncbi:membrane anchor subunit of succinate dehydrogenase, Sdh4 [Tulasnella sp. UAMH 9824]|nr:membrane anchor subunit of succinate dehydrogenase, Sdh4 [Tulasnella sp. UAMH 9824]